jgi:predicted nucleic acid-binding protein
LTSDSRFFVDTNVLVYLRDSRDRLKQQAAAAWIGWLWDARAGRVSTQVLHEYYVTVTSKLTPGLPVEDARDDVLALAAWYPIVPSMDLIEAAWDVQDRWAFSFWDSLIVAAARAAGCDVLLTEDLAADQQLGDILVVNPFVTTPEFLSGPTVG